ncbi:hypothetical protein H4W33_006593 [Kibdelosporangium phytohabitans]|nr:hypothetical protein [Kibdelosporangium phytohabitans]
MDQLGQVRSIPATDTNELGTTIDNRLSTQNHHDGSPYREQAMP